MKRVGTNRITVFIFWIIVSILSVFIGYVITGALPVTENPEMGYGTRLLEVLGNPFKGYFNDYSLIGMVVGFIISELVFGFVFIIKFSTASQNRGEFVDIAEMSQIKEENKDAGIDNDVIETAVSYEEKFEEVSEDYYEEDVFTGNEKKENKDDSNKVRKILSRDKQQEEPEKEFTMSQDVFLNLYNQGYSNEQIKAMMEITAYIPDIDVHMLTRMFNKTMEPDSIRDYIELMYG